MSIPRSALIERFTEMKVERDAARASLVRLTEENERLTNEARNIGESLHLKDVTIAGMADEHEFIVNNLKTQLAERDTEIERLKEELAFERGDKRNPQTMPLHAYNNLLEERNRLAASLEASNLRVKELRVAVDSAADFIVRCEADHKMRLAEVVSANTTQADAEHLAALTKEPWVLTPSNSLKLANLDREEDDCEWLPYPIVYKVGDQWFARTSEGAPLICSPHMEQALKQARDISLLRYTANQFKKGYDILFEETCSLRTVLRDVTEHRDKALDDLELHQRALNLHEIELRRACEEIEDLKGDLRVLRDIADYHGEHARYRGASQEHHERCLTTAYDAARDIETLCARVEHLETREQEAWDILEFGFYMDDNDHYRCISCSADLTKSGNVCHEGCKRAAWLAKCSES